MVVKVALPGPDHPNTDIVELKRLVDRLVDRDPRPNPWTSIQARQQAAEEARALGAVADHAAKERQRIESEVAEMNRILDRLRDYVRDQQEQAALWKGRINNNTARLDRLERRP